MSDSLALSVGRDEKGGDVIKEMNPVISFVCSSSLTRVWLCGRYSLRISGTLLSQ